LALVAWVLAYVVAFAPPPGQPSLPALYLIYGVPYLAFAAVGGLIIRHQRASLVGWIMCGIGVGQGLATAAAEVIRQLAASPGTSELAGWLLVVVMPVPVLATLLIVLLLVVFPDGRLPSPRWRWFLYVIGALSVVVVVFQITDPNPDAQIPGLPPSPLANPELAGLLAPLASFWLFPLAVAVAAASLVPRYRSGTVVVRQQIKWFILAAVVLALCEIGNNALASDVLSGLLDAAGKLAIVAAIGIAVLRHRLFDVDLAISRALAYGWLAALVTALYVALVVGVGALVGRPASPDLLLSLAATIVVAVVSLPLRSRLQAGANRLVYGRRQAPYEALAGFTRRLGERYAVDDLLAEMAAALGEGLRVMACAIYLDQHGQMELATAWPAGPVPPGADAVQSIEINHRGQRLGRLDLWTEPGQELTDTERRLLVDLAHQAGLVLHNARLTTELQRRLDELHASRHRLVNAQDAERRRLERDLHDGTQQDLVTLRMKLGQAERTAVDAAPHLTALLCELREHTAATLENIRRLSRGLYPPLLQAQGLGPALTAHSRRLAVPVDVRAVDARFAPELENAVYFCCVEALQNTAKHAQANRAWLSIERRNSNLSVEIGDNGRGFDLADIEYGSGLHNITDRIEVLGGRVQVNSAGAGTRIEASIPLDPKPSNHEV
jgi:signal transduction histidine kinase